MNYTELIGWIGVTLSFLSTYPQIFKALKTRCVDGISTYTYVLIFVAVICYLVRAINIGAKVFIVSNSLNAVSLGIMLILIFRYRRKCNEKVKELKDK